MFPFKKYEQQISPRNPNVAKKPNSATSNPPVTTIGTQTDTPSNIDKGKDSLGPSRVKNSFDDPHSDIPIPLSN